MEIFGYLICVLITVLATGGAIIITLFQMQPYNLGGAPNTWRQRWGLIPLWCVIIFAWRALIDASPFAVTVI